MSAFDDTLAGGLTAIRQIAGGTVTYRRGATTGSVNAAVGKTDFQAADGDQTLVTWSSVDFLIAVAELLLAGNPIEPAAGDRIERTIAGQTVIHEVTAPPGEPVLAFSDPGHTQYRIHTKRIG